MNFKTQQELPEAAIVTIRPFVHPPKDYSEEDVICKGTFAVPSTEKEWQDIL